MRPLIGSDRRYYEAPTTVLAADYTGRRFGGGGPITLPAGTEVQQTGADGMYGRMRAFVDGDWLIVEAP